jgi:hypothetical protein
MAAGGAVLVGLVVALVLVLGGGGGSEPSPGPSPTPEPTPAPTPEPGPTSDVLTITSVDAEDLGDTIKVTIEYCDDTGGNLNDYVYVVGIGDSDGTTESASTTGSVSDDCGVGEVDVPDSFNIGEDAAVSVSLENTTSGSYVESETTVFIAD